jgi:hypothetical protein
MRSNIRRISPGERSAPRWVTAFSFPQENRSAPRALVPNTLPSGNMGQSETCQTPSRLVPGGWHGPSEAISTPDSSRRNDAARAHRVLPSLTLRVLEEGGLISLGRLRCKRSSGPKESHCWREAVDTTAHRAVLKRVCTTRGTDLVATDFTVRGRSRRTGWNRQAECAMPSRSLRSRRADGESRAATTDRLAVTLLVTVLLEERCTTARRGRWKGPADVALAAPGSASLGPIPGEQHRGRLGLRH